MTDALGRVTTLDVDTLARTTSRVDKDLTEQLTTTWTWDTAANGIGKLEVLASPDGQKTYAYTGESKLETATLRIDGERAALTSRRDYDELGRVATITYPTPAGGAPFVVAHDHDAHGHVLAVGDAATRSAYWRLTDVDDAGRFREEVFGNGVVSATASSQSGATTRTSSGWRASSPGAAASGRVEHRYHVHSAERLVAIVTRGGAGAGTRYVHVDHLGSVDALTDDEDGEVIERRSYDPLGQHRNPVWGQPAPLAGRRRSPSISSGNRRSHGRIPRLSHGEPGVGGRASTCSAAWGDAPRLAAPRGGTRPDLQRRVGGRASTRSAAWGTRPDSQRRAEYLLGACRGIATAVPRPDG
ncbi:hypothetical protein WME94_17280 [Sorangium sp. So ce429]